MKRLIFVLTTVMVLISGFGPSQAGQVVFEWDANTESDLAGYRMYQSSVSGQYVYGKANAIGEIPAGTETFTLVTLADGTFYWVATAFDTAGNESGPSNEVSTTINFEPPKPPGGCVLRIP